MAESPHISLVTESLRHLRNGVSESLPHVGDIWRHEGLKKNFADRALYLMPNLPFREWIVDQITGEYIADSRLETKVGGLALDGPVGIGAGWDKTGKTVLGWQLLGAHHITLGGVPLYAQHGNPMPRLRTFDKRVGDHGTNVSLNAYGFPSIGASGVAHNVALQKDSGELTIPVIMQVTANKEMYEEHNRKAIPGVLATTVKKLLPVADAISIGLTSPNTLGMRDAQSLDFLYDCIMAVRQAAPDIPLEFKGDGDGGTERCDMYAELMLRTGVNILGLINTTALKEIKAKYGAGDMPGGLAGADSDYQQLAVKTVNYMYEAIGDKVDIIGMGGVNSGETAMQLIENGASGISINTAIRSLGARAVSTIELRMSNLLDSYPSGTTLPNIVGVATKRGSKVPTRI